jgi:ParB/RepB/Spo0J family partition protein
MTTEMETKTTIISCPLSQLRESKFNPRRHFDEKQLADLVESVKAKGVLNPILVRPLNDRFEIVGGARRFRAARAAGLSEIPCLVRELTDQEALEVAVIDNLQRADVHPLDEAEGYAALLDHQDGKYDVAAIAAKVGKSASFVYQRMKLVDLIEPAKKAFWKEEFTAGHAVLLARLRPEDQKEVLTWYADNSKYELIGTRELARHIESEVLVELNLAPWSKEDAGLVTAAGACTACPKRSSSSPELFSDIKKGDRCLDRPCFASKLTAYFARRQEEAAKFGLPVVVVSPEYSCPPGVLKSDRWHKLTNKKKCDKIAKGVIYSGGQRGQIIDVCTGMRCPIHSGYTQYQRDPKEIEKQRVRDKKEKREDELLKSLFTEAVKVAPGKLHRVLLEQLAEHAASGYGMPQWLDEIFTWRRRDVREIKKLSDLDLARYLSALALIENYGEINPKVKSFAKDWGVDVRMVETALKAKWQGEDAREKERLKEKQAKGEKLAAKAKKESPEPQEDVGPEEE